MLSLSKHLLRRAMDLREMAAREAEDAETLCRIAEELEDIADDVWTKTALKIGSSKPGRADSAPR